MQGELDGLRKERNLSATQRESVLREELNNMQKGIIELKIELEILRAEKDGCFNEYKSLYHREFEALEKRFEADVENAADAKAKANAQEYEGALEVLKGENAGLVSVSGAWPYPY